MRFLIGALFGFGIMLVLAASQKQTLESRVTVLENFMMNTILEDSQRQIARINVGQQGYEIAQTGYGAFAFLVQNVEPFASGSLVKLKVLNLTSAIISEADLTVTWRSQNKSISKEQINVLRPLVPGVWCTVEIKTTALKPTSLTGLFIEIKPSQVQAASN